MQIEYAYIYEVYQCGSFSKAAAKLYMTQPALSIAIRKVEAEIGSPIFTRHTKPLQLTEAGEVLIRNITLMKQLDDNLLNELQDLTHLEEGALRVGGTQYFNSHVLPPTLRRYMLRYPKVDLSLLEDNSGKIDSNLIAGTVDMTFHCGPYDESKLIGYDVFKDYLLLAIPISFPINKAMRKYALSKQEIEEDQFLDNDCPSIKLDKFNDVPFLFLTGSNNLRARALSMFAQENLTPNIRFSVEQLETSSYLANAELGAAFLSDKIIRDGGSSNLLYYKLNYPEAIRRYKAILRKQSYLSNIMKAFIADIQNTWKGTINENI